MFWQTILIDTPNGNLLFGYFSETSAILMFGICLILSTIGIRWFLARNDGLAKTMVESEKVGKR